VYHLPETAEKVTADFSMDFPDFRDFSKPLKKKGSIRRQQPQARRVADARFCKI
jgi:hypothetical protein